MTHRTPDLSLARHWLRALLRCGWWIARALGIINPIYATARKSMFADSSDQKDDRASLDIVRTNWEKWNLGKKPDSISWLLLTGGEKSYNKAVGLVFAESDSEPRVAVKMPRVATSIPNLLKEKTILEHLRASKQNHLQGVPRVLFWEQTDSFAILGETVVKGIPLYTTLRRSNFHELAMSASKWLIDLAKHSQSIPPTDSWNRLIESLVGNFEESFSKIIDSNLINKARAILGGLAPLPLVCEQRDFSPWNVMVTANGQLAILDWESAKLDGLPAVDLIYFLAHAGFFLDHAWQSRRFRESYRASLNRSMFTGTVYFDALACYFHELGLDFSALPALRLLAWMLYARFAYERLVSRLVAQPTVESLREILFLSLWEEELRHE